MAPSDEYALFREKFAIDKFTLYQNATFSVSLRPTQLTYGALLIAANMPATSFTELLIKSQSALSDYALAVKFIETAVLNELQYQKINYYTLMMVDPFFHIHVLPRYNPALQPLKGSAEVNKDPYWPGLVDFGGDSVIGASALMALKERLRLSAGEL